jgi:hypothetical protein
MASWSVSCLSTFIGGVRARTVPPSGVAALAKLGIPLANSLTETFLLTTDGNGKACCSLNTCLTELLEARSVDGNRCIRSPTPSTRHQLPTIISTAYPSVSPLPLGALASWQTRIWAELL